MIDPTPLDTDVLVVGGGLAGLAAAATAARAGARTLLLDAHPLGGRARVDRVGGYAFNRGPRALYVRGPGERVLRDLGVPTTRGAKPPLAGAMGLHGGELHLLPQGPTSLARTRILSRRQKLAFARKLVTLARLDPRACTGMSADAVLASLDLGPRGTEMARALVRLSTYTAATDLLDGPSAVAQVQLAARAGARYLDGGFQTLVDGLETAARSHGAAITTGVGVGDVTAEPDGRVRATTTDGASVSAATAVLAVGGPEATARLIGAAPASWSGLGPAPTAACLELGLRRPPPTRFVLGIDEPLYLATHGPPADLAPGGGAVVHVMRYLRPDEAGDPDGHRHQLRALARRAGIDDADVAEERFLARMVVAGGIPTAEGGGRAGRPPVEVPGRPDLLVAGDWVGPEGLLADAALASGAAAGARAARRAAKMATPWTSSARP